MNQTFKKLSYSIYSARHCILIVSSLSTAAIFLNAFACFFHETMQGLNSLWA